MSFFQDLRDLLTLERVSHVGPHQYEAHSGQHDGHSTSGPVMWARTESSELVNPDGNIFNAEENLIETRVRKELPAYIPEGVRVVELGPGTFTAFNKKTLLIIHALKSTTCTIVDKSHAFLKSIYDSKALLGIENLEQVEDDFFQPSRCYHDNDDEALVTLLGSTLGNMLGPLRDKLPEAALVNALQNVANATRKGWLLVSIDTDQNGERVQAYYKKQEEFQLNIFDRLIAAGLVDKRFKREAIEYDTEWRSSSGQLGHMAVIKRKLKFALAGMEVVLRKGQRLHLKNSFKFKPEFFEKCCNLAGLELVKVWSDDSTTQIWLLKKKPLSAQLIVEQRPRYQPQRELRTALAA